MHKAFALASGILLGTLVYGLHSLPVSDTAFAASQNIDSSQKPSSPQLLIKPAQSFSIGSDEPRENPASASPQLLQEPEQNPVASPQASQRVAAEALPTQIPSKESAYPTPTADAEVSVQTSNTKPTTPVRLSIPTISLDDDIIPVGLTSSGAMDVPSGNTSNVGWYKGGTLPGNVGSAVLDAHVFAAFSRLNTLSAGDDIYVTDAAGVARHFRVQSVVTYALADVPADVLFNRADTARLNLITCAGKLTPDHSTYDHRVVVYATLVR